MRKLVRLAIGSWLPLELNATWVFFGIVGGFCCNTPLKVSTLYLFCPPLEVGVGYCGGTDACLVRTDVGCGNIFCDSGANYSTVCQFANIIQIA